MEVLLKKLLVLPVLAAIAGFTMLASSGASPVAAAGGATVLNSCDVAPSFPLETNCNFHFWDGDGTLAQYRPTSYHDVITPNGSETEVFKGTIANGTGHAVIYTANSGDPIPAGQTCWSFASGRTTPDWQMTISASGNFSLVCHFGPLP
jgi:hypothetical protein